MKRTITMAALAALAAAAAATPASAASHEYCFWGGGYSANSAFDKCYAQGENYLTNNHAYLPYRPSNPTIFCGANLNGSQYASFTMNNPACNHTYGGGNLLKATEYVDVAAGVATDVLTVPLTAVEGAAGKGVVTVVGADGTEEEREITLGINDGTTVEVTGGLVEGDMVLEFVPGAVAPQEGCVDPTTGEVYC